MFSTRGVLNMYTCSALRHFLFNMFISDLTEVTKCTIKYFANTNLGGPVNMIKDRVASQRDLGKMEE